MCAATSDDNPGSADLALRSAARKVPSRWPENPGPRYTLHALRRWAGRIREAAPGAVFDEFPELAAAALEIEARRLRSPGIPELFARDLVQIPPTLNDDLLELYGRSEQALANRFGFFGEIQEFPARIDWERGGSAAWRAELHSFDFALDLALTLRISGDERYARHLCYLLAEWISSNPTGRTSGSLPLPLARRVRNWILTASLASEAFEGDAAFCEIFTASLARQVTLLAWQARGLEGRSAGLAASRALLLASHYFPCARGSELLEASQALILHALNRGMPSYAEHPQPLRQFELAAAWCDHALFGGEEDAGSADMARTQFRRSLEALEGMLHPDGTLPLFGCHPLPSAGEVSELFALGSALLDVPHWKSLSGGELGIVPYLLLGESGMQRFKMLPAESWRADSRLSSGHGIYRVSDGASSALLAVALPRGAGADHEDLFSYELTVGGQRTVVDSGVFAPPGETARDGFAAARAHNVLLVDGELPCPQFAKFQASAVAAAGAVQGVWLRTISDESRNNSPLRRWLGNHRSPRHAIACQRGFFLIEGRYWVVLDHLAGNGTYRIESLVHLYPAFSLEVLDGRAVVRSGAASVTILPLSRGGEIMKSVAESDTQPAGWYAPAAGVRYAGKTLAIEWPEAELPWIGGYLIQSEEMGVWTRM